MEAPLESIESAPVDRIGALSTSELAHYLSAVRKRIAFLPLVVAVCLVLCVGTGKLGDRLLFTTAVAYSLAFALLAIPLDRYRRSLKVEYDLSGFAGEVHEALTAAFAALANCRRVWNVSAEGRNADWKRHAGATTLNKRKRISLALTRPRGVRARLRFPALALSNLSLHLLPDAILAVGKKSATALNYRDVAIKISAVRFIEDEAVPSDSEVISRTWRFVNKNGGPDRRFNFNKELPVCLYGEMDVSSSGGLAGKIQFSKVDAADQLGRVLRALSDPRIGEAVTPIKSFQNPSGWLSILFTVCFLSIGAAIAAALLLDLKPTNTGQPLNAPPIAQPSNNAASSRGPSQKQVEPGPMVITPTVVPPSKSQAPLPRPRPR